MEEIWKDIPNYEGWYQISNYGRIKSLERYRVTNGRPFKTKEKILKYSHSGSYRLIRLSIESKVSAFLVHRLVASVFIRTPAHKEQVNHKNGDKKDNRVDNLEWVTQSENMLHAYRTGLQRPVRGEKSGSAKLNTSQVLEIRDRYTAGGVTHQELAREYNIGRLQILRIVTRQRWAHI